MKYSKKAIEKLINRMTGQSCLDCLVRKECEMSREMGGMTCKKEIERILTEWSEDENSD